MYQQLEFIHRKNIKKKFCMIKKFRKFAHL